MTTPTQTQYDLGTTAGVAFLQSEEAQAPWPLSTFLSSVTPDQLQQFAAAFAKVVLDAALAGG